MDEHQDSFIQNMLMDYKGSEIMDIIGKGEQEMLLNVNVFLSSIGQNEIERQHIADE